MTVAETDRRALTSPSGTILYSDEPEMESSLHYFQLMLLVSCLSFYWRDRDDFFIGANLTIYYSPHKIRNRDFRGPDFFLVKNTDNRPRASWAVWEEGGRLPNAIIELLSDSTADVDRAEKKRIYQDRLRTPEYFWFHPATLEFAGWRLDGESYSKIIPNERGWRWSRELELYLGAIDGKLRYLDADGNVIPTPEEGNLAAQAQAELESQRAELERQQSEQYRQQLELESQRAELERQQSEQYRQQLELESQRAERERQQSEQYRQQLELESQRAEQADLARDEAVVRLLALGLTIEQVAASFALSPEEIRAIAARLNDTI